MFARKTSSTRITFRTPCTWAAARSSSKSKTNFLIATRRSFVIAAVGDGPRSRPKVCKRWATKTSAPWPAASKPGKPLVYRRRNNSKRACLRRQNFPKLAILNVSNSPKASTFIAAIGLVLVAFFLSGSTTNPADVYLPQLTDKDPDIRVEALRKLLTSLDSRIPEAMLSLLSDEGNSIRRLAARAIGSRWWQIPTDKSDSYVNALQ